MRNGEIILKSRLSATETEYNKLLSGEVENEITREVAIQPCWPNQKKVVKNHSTNTKNISIKNLSGVIGLNSEGNDAIRNEGNKNHYWFHLESYSGSHCIIKTEDIGQLSFGELSAIASMLRDMSHLEILEIPMLYTQLKYVKGIKGSAGKVIVNKSKHLRCHYISWKDIIYI
jgi:predicted ribosome quality control (RQC) complex YloA/Tae2 family protein